MGTHSERLTAIAIIRAKSGKNEMLRDALRDLVAPTRTEAGCVEYIAYELPATPSVFHVYETWADAGALDFHRATPWFGAFLKKLPDIAEGSVELVVMKPIV